MSHNIYDNVRTRVIVLQEQQLLLLNDRGTWLPPGGGLEPHETMLECAVREVYEETGVEVEATSIAFLGEWIYPRYAPCPQKRIQHGYGLEVYIYAHPIRANQVLRREGPDFPQPAWVPLDQIASLPLWPKELKTVASMLLSGQTLMGMPILIKQLESTQAMAPDELNYTRITASPGSMVK